MLQSELSQFTQRRNWTIARMRGATSIFAYCSMCDFSPEIIKEASEVKSSIVNLERLLATTWKEQKEYFLKQHPVRKG